MADQALSVNDRFEIFEQLHLHQHCIDNDPSIESATKYQGLYWPEAVFTVHDVRGQEFKGPEGLKELYDYAHSVFPLGKWRHSLGTFVIEGSGNKATAVWRWIVSWKDLRLGQVSGGTYTDEFEKRNGVWKCLTRVSDTDPNFPADLFQPYVDNEKALFKAS